MSTNSSNLAPESAWLPLEQREAQRWNHRLAAHLYRRAGFGATLTELDEAVELGPEACVEQLIAASSSSNESTHAFDDQMSEMGQGLIGSEPEALEPWWLYRMLFTPAVLRERMTLLWHGHFASSAATVQNTAMMLSQNETLRKHGLGRFEPLVQAISRDPAMLTYLNSTTNAKLHPNENYARELMELFCLGIGNYTERDIQEVARCFTGWEIRRGQYRFNKHQHDFGSKTIFGRSGKFDGDDAIRIILKQDAAATHVARTLVQYFVCDHPVPDAMIAPLATELRRTDFHIESIVRRILRSRYFYSQASIGQKIRGPVELAVGLLRSLNGTVGTIELARELRPLGQRVFFPPNVKGWDGGRSWINATTLINRVNLATKLIRIGNARVTGQSLMSAAISGVEHNKQRQAGHVVDQLTDQLVALPLRPEARSVLQRITSDGDGDIHESARNVLVTMAAMPEFQLG